jgi:membrane protein
LWIVVAAAGAFVGRESARGVVLGWVTNNIGPAAANYVSEIVTQVNQSSALATIGGAIAVFFAATAAFAALQSSLARIWNLPDRPAETFLAGLQDFVKNFFTIRLLAFVVMMVFGILLVGFLLAGAVLEFVDSTMPANLPAPHFVLQVAGFLLSTFFLMLLFATLYYLLHRSSFVHGEIWVGAAVTASLLAIGNSIIGPYLGGTGLRSAYGAAGSFVLLLLWVYYSVQILLFGAAFTEVFARHRKHT